ncbi:hypothetical protein DL546_007381 [Coniochaeta pulveracea]|uniref:Rab-GAP TBC domain-containing protein n=1 Tax=Coniochaeta pulveracea TaxID=177199 RepID=A0A420YH26_9PEZI|nr:hypothetical protein DL546_007381 [Coniochaeta pulveracea]
MDNRELGLPTPRVDISQSDDRPAAIRLETGMSANAAATREAGHYGSWHNNNDEEDYYDDDVVTELEIPSSRSLIRPLSPSIHQLPPLPLSPISPRWDSLPHNTSSTLASHSSDPRPGSGGGRIQPSNLPNPLASHPVSPEVKATLPSNPALRAFPLLDQVAGAPRYHRPITPSSSTTRSFRTDSPSFMDYENVVENFSRPRKLSIRQGTNHPTAAPEPVASNASLNPSLQQLDWPRDRGFSTSSARSTNTTNTFTSLPHQPSDNQISFTYRTASVRRPNPTYLTRPPMSYKVTSAPSTPRDPPPWLAGSIEEGRSSVRSQLSASTHLGTIFTNTGTERSSVLSKTSSITESLIINGYARASMAESEGLSLEDVMGMYENGFHDDSDTEEHPDLEDDGEGSTEELGSTPEIQVDAASETPTKTPDAGTLEEQMSEATSNPLPVPKALNVPTFGPFVARDSAAIFRNSGLPSSLPNDVGIGLDSATHANRTEEDKVERDEVAQKHDSTGTLTADEGQQSIERETDDAMTGAHTSPISSPSPVYDSPAEGSSTRAATPPFVAMLPLEPDEDPRSRDRYGFRKSNPYVSLEQYDTWNASYTEYLARRRKKWMAYMKDNSLMTDHPDRFPPRSAKTKRFVRKGIPPDWRGAAWFYYAGGPAILAKHNGVYADLVRRAGLDPVGAGKLGNRASEVKPLVVEDIEKDLHRTFPDNIRFKPPKKARPPPSSPATTEDSQMTLTNKFPDQISATPEHPAEPDIISSLRRVLHAFALYNPRIGYCQSLNFLAGLLLLFVESEEHAFWLLNVITRVYLPGTHEMSLEGSKVDLGVLMGALKESLPAVWKQIGGDEADPTAPPPKKSRGRRMKENGHNPPADPNRLPAITLCMTAWFMSCFIGTLPIETVLRVWDVFFYEGSRTLFRIALTIFKAGESEIKSVADPMEMFGVVQSIPRRMLDCNALLEACYKRRNGIGHLTQGIVEERRQERRDGIRRWRAAQEAANNPVAAVAAKQAAAGLDLAAANLAEAEAMEVRRKDSPQLLLFDTSEEL